MVIRTKVSPINSDVQILLTNISTIYKLVGDNDEFTVASDIDITGVAIYVASGKVLDNVFIDLDLLLLST